MPTVEIEWIDSISVAATGNKIYRDTVPSTGEVEIADIANGIQIYQDTTAETGTEYKYEVQAHDGAGDETTQEVEGENMDYITTASSPSFGPELVTNGDFSDGANDWTLGVGVTVSTSADADGTAEAYSQLLNQSSLVGSVSGRTYQLTYTILPGMTGAVRPSMGAVNGTEVNTAGTHTEQITISSDNTSLQFVNRFPVLVGSIDDISVKEVLLTSLQVDNYLIAEANAGTTNQVIDLSSSQPRTSASDAAVITLTNAGNTVITS